LPFVLAGVQALWVFRSLGIVRFEEVAEGARNAWWLQHHALFDGISTNVGWYAPALAAFRLLGDPLYAARWGKLALYLVAVLCLAWVLRRPTVGLSPGRAAVPLLAMGLSPSVLFFGTVGTSFGTDLLYLPALLAIVLLLRARSDRTSWAGGLLAAAFGALAMVAWTSYPVFVFYLPALALAYLWATRSDSAPRALRAGLPALGGFLLPLALAAAWLRHPGRLFHDPATGSGLFRGGGTGFDLDPASVARGAGVALHDLFVRGTSYYYWVERPDLAGPLGIAAFVVVAAGSLYLLRARPAWRPWTVLAAVLPVVNLLVVSAGTGPQGLRRSTTLLAGFYLLFTLVWRRVTEGREGAAPTRWTRCAAVLLALLPLHHLVSAVEQYRALPTAGAEQTHLWLRVAPTADGSLRHWLGRTAAGHPLDCRELGLEPERCQYGGVYALLSGHRRWNGEPEVPLRAWDYETGRSVELSVEGLSGEFSR
jgi:hypothetical protein